MRRRLELDIQKVYSLKLKSNSLLDYVLELMFGKGICERGGKTDSTLLCFLSSYFLFLNLVS